MLAGERQFSADASHELRTPLTVLSGELELARARADHDPALAGAVERAGAQVGAMRDLVEALLLLRRAAEHGPGGVAGFEPVNLADLLRDELAEAAARHAGRSADVTQSAPDELLVLGSPALLHAAVRNLVDNALKFSCAGQAVRVSVTATGNRARLVVEDGGPGIPREERERVFAPFYRGAEARAGGGGFGLGLPILRRVARAHGGDVVVDGSPLGGARFELSLPRLECRA